MISCTEFIPAYDQLFKTLHRLGGKEAVEAYWDKIAEKYLDRLKELVTEHGLKGCWLYWSTTLSEEAADFTMELDEENNLFSITMHRCPSKGRLIDTRHIDPYPHYCEHCRIYKTALEPMGYEVVSDFSQCDEARCSFTVSRKS